MMIIMCKNHKLLLVTEIAFCNNPIGNGFFLRELLGSQLLHKFTKQFGSKILSRFGTGVQAEGTGGVQMNTKILIYFKIQAGRQGFTE